MKRQNKLPLGASLLVALAVGYLPPALSQTDTGGRSDVIEEIVVTARLRSESLIKVPVTVNVFSREDIEDAGIRRPNDYLSLVPNVTLQPALH